MKMLRSFGYPVKHMSQHHATMLQDVALKCCERLARPLNSLMLFFNLEDGKEMRTARAERLFWLLLTNISIIFSGEYKNLELRGEYNILEERLLSQSSTFRAFLSCFSPLFCTFLIFTAENYTKTIIRHRLSKYWGIFTSTEQLQNTRPQLTTIVSPMRHLLKNQT